MAQDHSQGPAPAANGERRFRLLPSVQRLLQHPRAGPLGAGFGREALMTALRSVLDRQRERIVSGDPLRTNAHAFAHNGYLGFPTAKRIVLPDDWEARLVRLSG